MQYFSNLNKLGVLALLIIPAMSAHADDTDPPSWRLTNPSCTVQEWDFNTPTLPLAPDGNTWGSGGGGFVNPNGTPLLTTNTTGIWNASYGARSGVYSFAGNQVIDFTIPNDNGGPNDPKEMWIQLSFYAAGTPLTPVVGIASTYFNGPATLVTQTTMSDGWTHASYDVHMTGCPAIERMTLVNNTPVVMGLDEVVVDTICRPVPEPASLTALGIGALALIRRRRRRS